MNNRKPKWAPKPPLKLQGRMVVTRPEGYWAIRVSHRAPHPRGKGWISPRYLLRCGCCDSKLEIYYDDETLEINGVLGSIENWREILLPLFAGKKRRSPKRPHGRAKRPR